MFAVFDLFFYFLCQKSGLVYVAPHQWSIPFNLPLSWLGFPQKRTLFLSINHQNNPFGNE
ncbi:MAG: DUF4336 domain-containing protein, partial [Sphaerospermopsis kisseleviana]